MRKIKIVTASLLCILLHSCSTSEVINCDDTRLVLYGAGFTTSDFFDAMLYRYEKNGTFHDLIDSISLPYRYFAGDTIEMTEISADLDYKIWIPAVNKTYLLTNIKRRGEKKRTISHGFMDNKYYTCSNNVISADINGNPTATDQNIYGYSDALYLRK